MPVQKNAGPAPPKSTRAQQEARYANDKAHQCFGGEQRGDNWNRVVGIVDGQSSRNQNETEILVEQSDRCQEPVIERLIDERVVEREHIFG